VSLACAESNLTSIICSSQLLPSRSSPQPLHSRPSCNRFGGVPFLLCGPFAPQSAARLPADWPTTTPLVPRRSRSAYVSPFVSRMATNPDEEHRQLLTSLKTGFYVSLATIAGAVVFYNVAAPPNSAEKSYFTRLIETYTESHETTIERNARHADAVEQAAADRILFYNSPVTPRYELRYPEYVEMMPIASDTRANAMPFFAGNSTTELLTMSPPDVEVPTSITSSPNIRRSSKKPRRPS
jgi:hypothetical protein